jgi:hypothetical protein
MRSRRPELVFVLRVSERWRGHGDPRDNFNPDIEDEVWPYQCVNNSTETLTLSAFEYVEIRMVFSGERDERFDWTRVDVEPFREPMALESQSRAPQVSGRTRTPVSTARSESTRI